MLETSRQRLRKARLADLRLRSLDRIADTAKQSPTCVEVKHKVAGARIAVARLPDGARIEEPSLVAEVHLGSGGREAARDRAAREREGEGDVAVADEDRLLAGHPERRRRDPRREDVLPDGVTRASVVEADAPADGGRRGRLEERLRVLVEDGGRPASARGSVVRELVEIESAEDAEVVVPDETDVRVPSDEAAALVGARPVPYEVAEAPDLVRRLARDRFQHRLERMQVSVDVRDDKRAHGGRGTLAKVAAGVALAAVWGAAAVLLARTRVPPLDLPDLDPGRYFAAGELERGREFRAVTRRLWVASVGVELGVLAVVVWKARPLAGALARVAHGRVRTGVAVGLVAVSATWVATLPLAAGRHGWNRRYDLSRQGYGDWLGDRAIGLGVRAVLVSIAVSGAVFLAARIGRRWWLAGAPALVAIGVVYVLAQPLVVQPLFNRFEPLPDRALAAEVERLGDRIGVDVETVQVADASRRTTTANAYVAGIGPTRRVVFYDTILDGRFGEPELVSVAAHELAHVARRHLWKGTAWFALLAVPGLFAVAWVTERRGGLRDPALVPLGLLVAVALSLVTLPLQNALSRRYEAEADWIALQATGDPDAAIALDHRLVVTSLGDPDPPAWAEVLLSTHPPAIDRIAMAEAFRERGGP